MNITVLRSTEGPPTITFEDEIEDGATRVYAGLRPHPKKPNRWLAWVARQPALQASGATISEAMVRLHQLPGLASCRIRFIEGDELPLPPRVTAP